MGTSVLRMIRYEKNCRRPMMDVLYGYRRFR
jgi:hypothetical protein